MEHKNNADRFCMVERRRRVDRRKNAKQICSKHWFMGNRAYVRRKDDKKNEYLIDHYSNKLLALILFIIFLSISDACLTLFLLDKGATEINPVMAYFLTHGPIVFFWAKYLLTTFSLLIILVYSNTYLFQTRIRTKVLFGLFTIPFIMVVYWEFVLIFSL